MGMGTPDSPPPKKKNVSSRVAESEDAKILYFFLRRMAIFFGVLRVSGSRQVEGKTSLLPLEPLEPLREVRSFQRAKNFMVIKWNP